MDVKFTVKLKKDMYDYWKKEYNFKPEEEDYPVIDHSNKAFLIIRDRKFYEIYANAVYIYKVFDPMIKKYGTYIQPRPRKTTNYLQHKEQINEYD